MLLAKLQRTAIAGRKQFVLAVLATIPHRADRVDHVLRRESVAQGDLGIAGRAASKRAAFGKQLRPGGAMDCTVDATTAKQRRVSRVDDGVNAQRGDVSDKNFKPRRTDLARGQGFDRRCG